MAEIINFNEYQEQARRTQNPNLTMQERTEHALYGLAAEVGEVMSVYQKIHQGHRFDREALIKELGDCLWFIAELCDVNNVFMAEVAARNIEKLKERYQNGFTVSESVNRKEYRDGCGKDYCELING